MSTVDANIVRIAERRLHLVTDDEVQQLGLTPLSIRRRIESGQLHRVLPGVLSTTAGPYDVPQRALALCLSIPDAVLSHVSAAEYWGIRRVPKDRVDVTVPHNTWVLDRRAVVHYSNRMPEHHVLDLVDGVRVTSVARTVFDLGGVLDEQGHLSVIEDVRNKGLCTDAELGEVYHDMCGRGRRGSAAWRRLAHLTERTGRPAMSELELEFQEALVVAGLAPAVQQHPVVLPNGRTIYLDLAYPDCRLDIEIDHSEWHATASAVEQDKARDLGLAILGWERMRFTDRAIEHRLRVCVAMVIAVIDLRRRLDCPPAA
jgi:predicted transcriptional regulator of viral defense system